MLRTSRIASGFDIELQLGPGWFLTAFRALKSVDTSGELPVVTSVAIHNLDDDFDLDIGIENGPEDSVKLELNDSGSELTIRNSTGVTFTVPFGAIPDLAGPPVLVKLLGDLDHEGVIAVLANLNIHAEGQSVARLPAGEIVARGDPASALPFLPRDKHIAFGIGEATYARIANNIWHTRLRATDGTHPLPDAANNVGSWSAVSMGARDGKIELTLEGDISIDTPWIDIVPDPHVSIKLWVIPEITPAGGTRFQIEVEANVDMGLLGDLLGAVIGGIIGFVVGLFTGNPLVGLGAGVLAGPLVIELVEAIAGGVIFLVVFVTLNGRRLPDVLCNRSGIVQRATRPRDGIDLSVLNAIRSIPISTAYPEGELLYQRSLLVTSIYDDLAVNANGFAVAGTTVVEERVQPDIVSLVAANYNGAVLASLTFEREDGVQQELAKAEVVTRASAGELHAPFRILFPPDGSTFRIPEGKLACVCLRPAAIRREGTVVQEIEFENGLRLNVPDAIELQDVAGILVTGYQLIHPSDYNAYYRARADFFEDNNFEELPSMDG